MATWPSTLPAPKLAGYQITPLPQTLRTAMEFGAARSRRRSYARNDNIAVSWIMTDAQYSAFRTWFESDSEAAGGSAWFTISLPIGETGITSQEARFVGEPQEALAGALLWAISATLEVR